MNHAVNLADPIPDALGSMQRGSTKGQWSDFFGYHVDMLEEPFSVFDRRSIAIPLQTFADNLLQTYWQRVHVIYPILHWPTFMIEYNKLWSLESVPAGDCSFEEVVFHATLNMVLALGCQCSESMSSTQRQYQSSEFYRRSQRLISIETLDTSSLPVVQVLLLRALYLYYASLAERCLIMLAAAHRVAVGLGLHTNQSRSIDSQLRREMRLRVWHFGVVVLDQATSSAFARPALLYKQTSFPPLPQEIDDEYLSVTGEGRQPEGLPSRLTFNLLGVKTTSVIDDMRAMRFTPNSKRAAASGSSRSTSGPDPGAILQINSRLEDIIQSLPPHLDISLGSINQGLTDEQLAVFRFQGRVFRTRILLLRILLLRPSLLAQSQTWASLATQPGSSSSARLEERFQREICEMCIVSAQMALQEMDEHLNTVLEYPGWYALQLTFNAALILIAASLFPSFGINFDVEPGRTAWERAIRIMETHKGKFSSAERGLRVLHEFRSRVASRAGSTSSYGHHASGGYLHDQHLDPGSVLGGHMTSVDPFIPGPMLGEGMNSGEASGTLDQTWMTIQDFGQNDWVLRFPAGPEDRQQ